MIETASGFESRTARYNSECCRCHQRIEVGDQIRWRPLEAYHEICPPPKPLPPEIAELPLYDERPPLPDTDYPISPWPAARLPEFGRGLPYVERTVSRTLPESTDHRTPVAQRDVRLPITTATGSAIADCPIHLGTFTVVYPNDTHRTLRLRRQPVDHTFAPGEVIAMYLRGADNTRDYEGFAFVKPSPTRIAMWRRFYDNIDLREALAVVLRQPHETGLAYALRSSNCWRCNRTLTVPASVHRGLGPICARVVAGELPEDTED